MKIFTSDDNYVLDNIIAARRSIRQFKKEIPPEESIQAIVEAGMKAPFASISASDVEIFRFFYIIRNGNPLLKKIDELIRLQTKLDLDQLGREMEGNPTLNQRGKVVQGLWSKVAENGIPGFLDSPYMVIAAEWRGARRAEKQSLAHVMQNMWLTATVQNLGFVLVSPIESMTYNKEFCDLFDKPVGDFGFNGCLIGYPLQDPEKLTNKKVSGKITWL